MAQPANGTVVLAISRQLGSGGSYIGQAVAGRLGLYYADRDILHDAAVALGVEAEAIAPLEERVESFWVRVLERFAASSADGRYTPPRMPGLDPAELLEVERRLMHEIARREHAVIVGRGAAHVLRGHPGLFSIFVHAPEAMRVARARDAYHLATEAEAVALLHRSDRQRAAFVSALAGQPWMTASLYDLCVNTATVGLDAAADMVTEMVRARLVGRAGTSAIG